MCRQPLLQRLLLPSHHQAVPALPSRLPGPLHPRWEYSGVPNVLMVRKLLLFNWPPTSGRGGDVQGNMPAACCPCPNPRGFLDLCISGGNILIFHTSWCSLYYTHIHTLSVLFVMPSVNPCLRAASCLPAAHLFPSALLHADQPLYDCGPGLKCHEYIKQCFHDPPEMGEWEATRQVRTARLRLCIHIFRIELWKTFGGAGWVRLCTALLC